MIRVQILMSTYNGEKYLEQQLESIFNQDFKEISILIRDDGSTDDTINIIRRLEDNDNRIKHYQGNNIGAKNSFFDLLKRVDYDMDFYAFSDQDDVWKPDKISNAIKKMITYENIPVLYCGSTILVNDKLEPLKNSIKKPVITPSFGNALIENICFGCTCVFNNELIKIVCSNIPEYTIMHDWWLYLCASAYGIVIYDENAYILYRQHANNVVGSRANFIDELKSRVKNYKKNRGKISKQIEEFHKLYNLDSKNLEMINLVLHAKDKFGSRLHLIIGNRVYRQRNIDNLIFKLLFLGGKI